MPLCQDGSLPRDTSGAPSLPLSPVWRLTVHIPAERAGTGTAGAESRTNAMAEARVLLSGRRPRVGSRCSSHVRARPSNRGWQSATNAVPLRGNATAIGQAHLAILLTAREPIRLSLATRGVEACR